jgi:hypothetical protein
MYSSINVDVSGSTPALSSGKTEMIILYGDDLHTWFKEDRFSGCGAIYISEQGPET